MAKKDKGNKAEKAEKKSKKGENGQTLAVYSKETTPFLRSGNVSLDGDLVRVNYRKPRASTRLDVVFHKNDLLAFAVGTEEEGGYVVTDHPSIALPTVSASLSNVESDGAFIKGSDVNSGLDVYVNSAKIQTISQVV